MGRTSAPMRRALRLARKGWGQTAPNPMVGAVVVREGVVVGEGFHARHGEEHAEVVALRAAGDRARGATLYVTLEPCAHHGKTPPCVDAVIAAGVKRVVVAALDPTELAGGGADRLRDAGIDVAVGDGEEEARSLNAPFFHTDRTRPWIQLKLAISLDGSIADSGGRSQWITGIAARREVQAMRANSDAIAVGVHTALLDDPSLTVRGRLKPRVPPIRVVFDSTARLPVDSQLVTGVSRAPVLVLTSRSAQASRVDALRAAGVEVLSGNSLSERLQLLASRGVRSLLVEGGARLAGTLLESGMVDRLVIFSAPMVIGAGSLNAFGFVSGRRLEHALRFHVQSRKVLGDDLMTTLVPERD